MTQNIQQWLAEIRILQNQVADLRQERDEAYGSAANWRKLYETEARQRREDISELQKTIQDLRNLLDQKQASGSRLKAGHQQISEALSADIQNLPQEKLRVLLTKTLADCHRLQTELEGEKADHVKTQQSLMSALSETVDTLTKERLTHQKSQETTKS